MATRWQCCWQIPRKAAFQKPCVQSRESFSAQKSLQRQLPPFAEVLGTHPPQAPPALWKWGSPQAESLLPLRWGILPNPAPNALIPPPAAPNPLPRTPVDPHPLPCLSFPTPPLPLPLSSDVQGHPRDAALQGGPGDAGSHHAGPQHPPSLAFGAGARGELGDP